MSDDPEDPSYPDFALVRPYVASITDPPPAGQRGGRVLPAYDRPTELIRVHDVADGPDDDQPVRARHARGAPMSGRFRATVAIAAAIVLTGSAGGVYAALSSDEGPVNFGARAVLPALPTSGAVPSQSVSPSPAASRTTRAAVDLTPTPSPSSAASATPKAVVGTPSTTPTHPFGPGQPNLAAGRTVTSSGFSDVYVPANAVDGDPNTYWESTHWQDSRHRRPQWLTVDLGQTATIGRIVLTLPPQPAWSARTQTITILGSTSANHFSMIVGTANYRFDPATGNTVTITLKSATARYVQLIFTANTVWPAGQISEIEIFAA